MRHALLVLAFAGCTETRAGLTGTQSLDVEVTSPTSVGSTTMRLPDNAKRLPLLRKRLPLEGKALPQCVTRLPEVRSRRHVVATHTAVAYAVIATAGSAPPRSGARDRIRRINDSPSSSGIPMSDTRTSGRARSSAVIAAATLPTESTVAPTPAIA